MDTTLNTEEIKSVAYAYANPGTSIATLAKKYNTSVSKISIWLVEAIERGCVEELDKRHIIMTKHIEEYEKINNLRNSSLRSLYSAAMIANK